MEKLYVICEECKNLFKIETKTYIGSAPMPHTPEEDDRLIETHVELFIDERRKLKVPTYTMTFVLERKCPNCGHLGNYTYKDWKREKEIDKYQIGGMLMKIQQLASENNELKRLLGKQKDNGKNPLAT